MYLGISSHLEHSDPQDWASKHVALGLKSVNFPVTVLDVVNMITSPQRYFFNDEFLHECFEKLKGTICSCHLKDVRLKEEYTFQLEECACGNGILDLELYARLADAESPRMPMIIEHLTTDEEYEASVKYVQKRLGIH